MLVSKIIVILLCFILSGADLLAGPDQASEDVYFSELRERMVDKQIVARGVEDQAVLAAMLKVPRHEFVPRKLRILAYQDYPLAIGYDQTISQPYIVALMSELAQIGPEDQVLEIGTGSGYQAAILAELAAQVYSMEILQPLAATSRQRLLDLGYQNIRVKCGNGYLGWSQYAPYDAIIVTCAPEKVPAALLDQLDLGGRLVIPVGASYQELKVFTKTESGIEEQSIIPVRFVPMIKSGRN
ncbi:protein-L-isoaspartate(D-aspartate) O-methyltransferase [Candidatus Omnitrophota bacterium]